MKSRLAFLVVLLAATPKTKNLALRTYFLGSSAEQMFRISIQRFF